MSQQLTRGDNDIQGQDAAKTTKSPDACSSAQAVALPKPATLEWSPHQRGEETLDGHRGSELAVLMLHELELCPFHHGWGLRVHIRKRGCSLDS